MELQPYQQRVIEEKTELDEKRTKLYAFKQTEIYKKLPDDERNRLDHQYFHMGAYSDILAARITEFKG